MTPGYKYDIFISYAHIDNLALPGESVGWIEHFYKSLNVMLAQRFGKQDMVKIWWDSKKLDGSVLYNDSIEEGLKESAVMICLHSPGYRASKYCNLELDVFYKKIRAEKTGARVGFRSRIVHVLLNNMPYLEWPPQLGGSTGFPFHDSNDTNDLGDPLDVDSDAYKKQMQTLRDAIYNLLKEFPNEQEDEPAAPGSFTIFMGEVPDTLRLTRKRLVTELEKKSFRVITGMPPPDEAKEHEKAVVTALRKADLSVHLLDQYPGREINGDPENSYAQKQAELALLEGRPQMIWVPGETNLEQIEVDSYRQFLAMLEKGNVSSMEGNTTSKEYEFLRGPKSSLAQEITDYAERLKTQQRPQQPSGGMLPVLLDTHLRDQMYALDLGKTLLENNIQPFINPQEDDPRKNIDLLKNRISQVKKMIFLYGNVGKEWIQGRMGAAIQLIIENNYPIEDFFVYLAPPHKKAVDIISSQRFIKINIFDSSSSASVNTASITNFLTALKTTPA